MNAFDLLKKPTAVAKRRTRTLGDITGDITNSYTPGTISKNAAPRAAALRAAPRRLHAGLSRAPAGLAKELLESFSNEQFLVDVSKWDVSSDVEEKCSRHLDFFEVNETRYVERVELQKDACDLKLLLDTLKAVVKDDFLPLVDDDDDDARLPSELTYKKLRAALRRYGVRRLRKAAHSLNLSFQALNDLKKAFESLKSEIHAASFEDCSKRPRNRRWMRTTMASPATRANDDRAARRQSLMFMKRDVVRRVKPATKLKSVVEEVVRLSRDLLTRIVAFADVDTLKGLCVGEEDVWCETSRMELSLRAIADSSLYDTRGFEFEDFSRASFLGEGATKTLYKAFNERSKSFEALAFLRDRADGEHDRDLRCMLLLSKEECFVKTLEVSRVSSNAFERRLTEKNKLDAYDKPFFVARMELCDGDLEALSVEESFLSRFCQLEDALKTLHSKYRAVHLDVKLLNVFSVENKIKLGDYGTVLFEPTPNSLTSAHLTTLENSPPDFLLDPSAKPGRSSDLFQLGLCLLHLAHRYEPYEEALKDVLCPSGLQVELTKAWTKQRGFEHVVEVAEQEGFEVFGNTLYRYFCLFWSAYERERAFIESEPERLVREWILENSSEFEVDLKTCADIFKRAFETLNRLELVSKLYRLISLNPKDREYLPRLGQLHQKPAQSH